MASIALGAFFCLLAAAAGAQHDVALEIGVTEMTVRHGEGLMRRHSMARVSGHDHNEQQMGRSSRNGSQAYHDAVMQSGPVGFWHMAVATGTSLVRGEGTACGQPNGELFGDPCVVDGEILGSPSEIAGLVPSDSVDEAMRFSGADDEEVKIPDHMLINTNSLGYAERTVELWFKADDPGSIDRVLYCEGNEAHSGLSMYVSGQAGSFSLNMFAWDRQNDNNEFGTALINADPISCPISLDTTYYVAMQFDSTLHSFTGYIKPPNATGFAMELCGQHTNMPSNVILKHHGHGGGNAIIGGVFASSRANGGTLTANGTEVGGQLTGSSHNFKGTVDDVAIYNKILSVTELETHFEAAQIV